MRIHPPIKLHGVIGISRSTTFCANAMKLRMELNVICMNGSLYRFIYF